MSSRRSLDEPRSLSETARDSHSSSASSDPLFPLPLTASVEDVLYFVMRSSGVDSMEGIDQDALVKDWAARLRGELLFSFGQLLRLPPPYLPRLGLPLLIEAEIERLILDVPYAS